MQRMTSNEKRAILSLSSIMSLRMIGLFMVLPVFALYATQFSSSSLLVGLSIGIYGLSQALFQIPFGMLSDKFGRRPIITLGLCVFVLGSFLTASAHTITLLIIGRALQGIGAVGSTILAYLSDLTREEQRTKAMAIAGISIGASFSVAMFLGPLLTHWIAINTLFYGAGLLGLAGILLLYTTVPTTPSTPPANQKSSLLDLLMHPKLYKLNIGIFILHAIFTATFVVLPINLIHLANYAANEQWHLYLPTLLIACILSLMGIGIAERRRMVSYFFTLNIFILLISIALFALAPSNKEYLFIALILFFMSFSSLEAFLPSLVSKCVPPQQKGGALGLYSCAQFSGIFVGGSLGGWLNGSFGFLGVYLFCIFISLLWLVLSFSMQELTPSSTIKFN